jgi:hypothetical protein
VIFPTKEEWLRKCPLHKGKRGAVRERLCAYLRRNTQYSWIPQTLSDGELTPRQAAFVAERYAYLASIRARANKSNRSKLDGLILRMLMAPTVRLVWAVALSLGVLACICVIVVSVR